MKLISARVAFCLAVAAPLAPVAAQTGGAITVGMQVTDAQGAPVGTVTAIQGDNLLVKTDKHEALLPKSGFTPSEGKLLFGMTQAQLNAEIEKSQAVADAAIAAGATVKGLAGTSIGTIESIDAANAVIKLASGQSISVARSGLRGDADGTVVVGLTAEQIEAQVKAAAQAPAQ